MARIKSSQFSSNNKLAHSEQYKSNICKKYRTVDGTILNGKPTKDGEQCIEWKGAPIQGSGTRDDCPDCCYDTYGGCSWSCDGNGNIYGGTGAVNNTCAQGAYCTGFPNGMWNACDGVPPGVQSTGCTCSQTQEHCWNNCEDQGGGGGPENCCESIYAYNSCVQLAGGQNTHWESINQGPGNCAPACGNSNLCDPGIGACVLVPDNAPWGEDVEWGDAVGEEIDRPPDDPEHGKDGMP